MAEKTFERSVVVTIGHTNMQRSVYWTRYAEWFGEVREWFMLELLHMSGFTAPEGMRLDEVFEQAQVALETADFHISYLRPTFFGDTVVIRLNTSNFTEEAVDLIGEFLKDGKKVACCRQKIVFVNPVAKKRIAIPDFLRVPAKQFEIAAPAAK